MREVKIHVNSTTRSSASWNLKLTQIPCTDFTGETSGDKTIGTTGPVTAGVAVGSGGTAAPMLY